VGIRGSFGKVGGKGEEVPWILFQGRLPTLWKVVYGKGSDGSSYVDMIVAGDCPILVVTYSETSKYE
jgi:hypothetical protein